jgi:hypothetical protein
MRHCACNNYRPGSAYTPDQCRRCWLHHEVPAARAWWDHGELPPADPYAAHAGEHATAQPCAGCLGQET